jgi:hypothetical protein
MRTWIPLLGAMWIAGALGCARPVHAMDEGGPRPLRSLTNRAGPAAGLPNIAFRVHNIGNIAFSISNTGYYGDRWDDCLNQAVPSLEFPIGTGVDYLYAGGLWVGGIRRGDTLVSLAITGSSSEGRDFLPAPYPGGGILERTIRPVLHHQPGALCPDVYYSEDAVSEQDFVAVYSDTAGKGLGIGGGSDLNRGALGIEVTAKSYAWSFDYAQDFILMEMLLKNVSGDSLRSVYMGIFMDQDILGPTGDFVDDITGFTQSVPSPANPQYRDTLNLAWAADNDGDPAGGRYFYYTPTGVAGVRVVQAPRGVQFAFNWWISPPSGGALNWGPNKADSKLKFASGLLGTPYSDREHYLMMANGEFDYPQWEAAIDHTDEGWLPPLSPLESAAHIADGYDTRYLLSFGPFDVLPDSTLRLTFALVTGANFHVDPYNFNNYFNALDPGPWLANLNFDDFARNAEWAGWVYDTPGFDTDGDGYRGKYRIIDGDTAYYTGDGVPDYQGPPPPPPPADLRFQTSEGKITLRWNGEHSETTKDPFSFHADFEGYRVYMSRTLRADGFALLTSRDEINWVRRKFKRLTGKWPIVGDPLSLDSLRKLYDEASVEYRGYPFHPDSFKVCDLQGALRQIRLDEIDPSVLDTGYYCFERFGANEKVDDTIAAYAVDSLGREMPGVIRRINPLADPSDTLYRDDGTPYAPYYEYEFVIGGLQVAEPVYLAVTTFDYGNPAAGLSPLESSPLANAIEIWPIGSARTVEADRPKPSVYPNPYRLADNYNANGWENPRGLEPDAERARRITFANIPDTCTISIWSLDGDLVRRLDHARDPGRSDATVEVWNLITRNTQAVKMGIYIYSIESRFGTDIGKLVVIK